MKTDLLPDEETNDCSFAKMLLAELAKNVITNANLPTNMYAMGVISDPSTWQVGTSLEKGIGKSLPQQPIKTRTKTYVPGYGSIEFPEKGDKYEYYNIDKNRRTLTVDYAETIWKPEVQVMVHFTRDDVDNPGTREYNDFMQSYSRITEKPVVKHDLKEGDIYKRKGYRGRQEFIIERFTDDYVVYRLIGTARRVSRKNSLTFFLDRFEKVEKPQLPEVKTYPSLKIGQIWKNKSSGRLCQIKECGRTFVSGVPTVHYFYGTDPGEATIYVKIDYFLSEFEFVREAEPQIEVGQIWISKLTGDEATIKALACDDSAKPVDMVVYSFKLPALNYSGNWVRPESVFRSKFIFSSKPEVKEPEIKINTVYKLKGQDEKVVPWFIYGSMVAFTSLSYDPQTMALITSHFLSIYEPI